MIRYSPAERLRAQPSRLVATVAIGIRGGEGVVVSHVAVGTRHNFSGRGQLMRARQRPACRAVIKDSRSPCDRVVARRAVRCGERCSRCWVRRIVRGLPSRQMASRITAICRCNRQCVVIVFVAIRAGHDFPGRCKLVLIRQRESCLRLIERRSPRNRRMARGA